ncbi:MAG: archaeal proteasome endopeptidase complex subunit alpha [Candidatus Bathyarchaeia archaeon]
MFAAPGAYDRVITIFSPEGRLFQVEYAVEAVKRGATVLGVVSKEGVVLAAEEKAPSKLQDPVFSWKIFQIDEHLGVAIVGLGADARVLIDQARLFAQSNRLTYDEPIDTEVLARRIADIKQIYTQHSGVRPFGVAMLFGGIDKDGPKLFVTLPGGDYWGYKAYALGAGSDAAVELLEAKHRDDMSLDEAIMLSLECLAKTVEGKLDARRVKMAVIGAADKRFRRLTDDEVNGYISKL